MLTPNQDFISSKGDKNQPDKSDWSKRQIDKAQQAEHNEVRQKAKSLVPDTSKKHSSAKKAVKKPADKPTKEQLAKYPAYYALNDYERSCLPTNNYWKVMNGQYIVEVPETDKEYHKYFDANCYKLAADYQKTQALAKANLEKQKLNSNAVEIKKEEPSMEASPIKQTEEVINDNKEVLVEPEKAKEPTQKANKNKPEHKVEDVASDARVHTAPVNKPASKKKNNKSDNNQPSLF